MDIPPGIEAMLLIASMAEEGYKPLYQINYYGTIVDAKVLSGNYE